LLVVLLFGVFKKQKPRSEKIAESSPEPRPATQTITSTVEPLIKETKSLIGNKYELLREIGRGGMGIVYEAINKEISKKVAIKKMKDELAINPREKERFINEARRVAELHHPNIVDIYDMFEEKGNIYLVFEYVDGDTVEKMLNTKGKFNLKEVVEIILSVCNALEYAHNKKIIHRDIKPSNIMVTKENFVKVMDFGIAREAKDTMSRLTGKDTSGTLLYMSPEQHLGNYDFRSDIYSLGVTMYEMLTCECVFKGPDFLAQKERMVIKKPSEIEPSLPAQVDEIILKCLQADREKRFQTVEELAKVLKELSIE
jgi:serine/threonine-protein kinase